MPVAEISQLRNLDFLKQRAFAYLTCERLYPNYLFFSNNYDFGNPSILRQAVDFLYKNLFENNPDINKIDVFKKEVFSNTPDPGEFDTELASAALDVCTAVRESLEFLKDNNFSRIVDISTFATDTVSMYIEDIESLDFNKDKDFKIKISNHPLMKKEFATQLKIISFLENIGKIDIEDITTLLDFQDNNKKGSLNL